MTLDPPILSRLQFIWIIGWHILLPAFTIGLASFIAAMEAAYIVTEREVLFRISSFWIKIFPVAFGMGVVSDIALGVIAASDNDHIIRCRIRMSYRASSASEDSDGRCAFDVCSA